MSGNTEKASIWNDADAYVNNDLAAALPATISTPFPAAWSLVGLLDGEAGFEHARNRDSSDFFGWGGILIRTARRNYVETVNFIALEENATTSGLVYPGSNATQRVVPTPNFRFNLALEKRDVATNKVRRLKTARYAEVEEVANITDKESDITRFEITAKIYPTAAGVLWAVQGHDPFSTT